MEDIIFFYSTNTQDTYNKRMTGLKNVAFHILTAMQKRHVVLIVAHLIHMVYFADLILDYLLLLVYPNQKKQGADTLEEITTSRRSRTIEFAEVLNLFSQIQIVSTLGRPENRCLDPIYKFYLVSFPHNVNILNIIQGKTQM